MESDMMLYPPMASLIEKGQTKLNEVMQTTKTEMTVVIPYNRDTDTLNTALANNLFSAVAKSEDGTNERQTKVYIPTDYDTTTMSQKYDEEKHQMVFTFKRK